MMAQQVLLDWELFQLRSEVLSCSIFIKNLIIR